MTSIEPQPAVPPPSPRFQFSLRTLLLSFVVLGSSLALFGAWGIVVFVVAVGAAICLHRPKPFGCLSSLALLMLFLGCLMTLLPAIGAPREGGSPFGMYRHTV